MFNVLTSICDMESLKPVWKLVGFIVDAIMIGVPILLIVLGMIDLGKAVISSKEDEVKKATKAFGKRFLYAVGVFAVVWMVTFVLGLLAKVESPDISYNEASWKACWNQIRNN